VLAVAGAMMSWVWAPPSDQDKKVYRLVPLFCGDRALMVFLEPMITVRVNVASVVTDFPPSFRVLR
jgi:hypothetical protein